MGLRIGGRPKRRGRPRDTTRAGGWTGGLRAAVRRWEDRYLGQPRLSSRSVIDKRPTGRGESLLQGFLPGPAIDVQGAPLFQRTPEDELEVELLCQSLEDPPLRDIFRLQGQHACLD